VLRKIISRAKMEAQVDPLTKVEGEAKKIFSFTLSHLVLIVILVGVVIFAFYLWSDRVAVKADAKSALSEEMAKDADKRAEMTQMQNLQLQEQLMEESNVRQADRAAQLQFQQSIIDQLKEQQTKVVTLAPSDLAILHGQLVGLPGPTVQGDAFLSTLPLEQKTVQMLEEIPALNSQLTSKDKSLADADVVIKNTQDQLTSEKGTRASDAVACIADKKSLNDQIAQIKADARKSKFKWAFGGAVILEILRIAFTRQI
jgi:biopolymer transport protein ExbD